MKYTVIIEKGTHTRGAYVPDLPGCVAVADTEKEVKELIKEAIEFHLEGIKKKVREFINQKLNRSILKKGFDK
jgi:predicted RNase H-like HicB family nuclease